MAVDKAFCGYLQTSALLGNLSVHVLFLRAQFTYTNVQVHLFEFGQGASLFNDPHLRLCQPVPVPFRGACM